MDLCFVDTETTSLSAETGHIWEFAGIRRCFPDSPFYAMDDGAQALNFPFIEVELEFQMKVDLAQADPFSLKIGKYYERFGKRGFWDGEESLDPSEIHVPNPEGEVIVDPFYAAALIEKFTRGTAMVGNCVSFDTERLERFLRAWEQCPGWHYHIIDIEPVIVGYAKAKGRDFPLPYSSSDISSYLGVEEPTDAERHTAMGDARWVQRMWDKIFD